MATVLFNIPPMNVSLKSKWDPKSSPGQYNPPLEYQSICKKMPVNMNHRFMQKVIGQHGIVFSAITRQTKVYYIWYDKQNSFIEVWGYDFETINDAVTRIENRMTTIKSQVISKKI